MPSFITTPARNPIKEPNPDRRATLEFFPASNSPATAPKNGPKMIPNGPRNNPAINPIVLPLTPALLPPNFLVPHTGTK